MNDNLCKNCDNFMFTYTDEYNILYNACKLCGNKESVNKKCIYKTTYNINKGEILNANKNLLNDITLPKIIDNPNIKCTNIECETNKTNKSIDISYIKYDESNMNYIYLCNICGQKWTNKE